MVIKGSARAEAGKLAMHLLRVDTNERADVREILGVCAPDLTEALREMEAVASAARSRRPFYHASINTAPNELMNDAQKARAIDRLEQELGLTGQPRVVVEHVKDGREHLHVAWSRINGETLCAIPDSHNYRKHEIVARELEREFEHARVQGAHHERDGVERPSRRPSHAETRQAERSGISPEDAKAQLRELWQSADSGLAFAAALDNAGWMLAQGDRRGFVALDPAGEVHAVNKAITGLTAAQVRDRLADLDPAALPTVDQAREQLRDRQQQPEAAPAPVIDHEADELARLEAMAQEFDSRDYGDQVAPEFEPVQDDFGHGHDDGSDLAHEREGDAEARWRADDAALDAEMAQMHREIAESEAALAELDAINEAVRDQFRQQREALNKTEFQTALDAMRAREAQQRGDDSALHAAHAMGDLARTDPIGTERNFGHHAGDRLKSPEEMRREWADLMRGGVSADQAAENAAGWEKMEAELAEDLARDPRTEKPAQDPEPVFTTPEPTPQRDQVNEPGRDPIAERTAWAERLRAFDRPDPVAARQAWADRLRGFDVKPDPVREPPRTAQADGPVFGDTRVAGNQPEATQRPSYEAGRKREPDKTPEKEAERSWLAQFIESGRERLASLAGKLEQAFQAMRHRQQQEQAADRPHDAAGDRQAEHVTLTPAQQQAQKRAPQPEAGRAQQREQDQSRPAERLGRSIADEMLAEARAELANERPQQQAARESPEANSRDSGDGSRERTRHRHNLLWELFYPFHDRRRRHYRP